MRPIACLAAVLLAACAPLPAERSAAPADMFGVPQSGQADATQAPARDLLVPGWHVEVTRIDEDRYRLHLRMRALITGGDGEARRVFLDSARRIVEADGHAGFDVLHYEEGIDSGLLFGRRNARGEIRVERSGLIGL